MDFSDSEAVNLPAPGMQSVDNEAEHLPDSTMQLIALANKNPKDNEPPVKKVHSDIKTIPHDLLFLTQYLEKEMQLLTATLNKKFKKGKQDKILLFSKAFEMVNNLINKHSPITEDELINVINHAALTAHHRRYSGWNTFASFFNNNFKKADSWVRFEAMLVLANVDNDSKLAPVVNALNNKNRLPLRVTGNNDEVADVMSYNQYREFIKP